MSKVYIVIGETGEYSDRTEWPVVAFTEESQAKRFVTAAETWLRVNKCSYDSTTMPYEDREIRSPFDPALHVAYTGCRYYFIDVDMGTEQQIADAEASYE